MTNRERLGIIFIIILLVLTLVFNSYSFILTDKFTNNISFENVPLLAKVETDIIATPTPTIQNQKSVEVIRDNSPFVQLEEIMDEQIFSVEKCETETTKKRYPIDQKKLASDAKCTSGYMEGTVVSIKMINAQNSISAIDELIELLNGTLNNINKNKSINNITFVGIPAGAEMKTAIENANNITVACINKDGKKENNKRVGKYSPISDTIFISSTPEQKKSLEFIKKSIKDLNSQIELSKGSPEDSVQKLLLQALEIVKKFKSDFIPVDASLLSDKSPFNKSDALRMTVNLEKNDSDKFIIDNPGTILSYKITFATRFMSGIPTIKEPYYKGGVTMSVGDESITNNKVVIPEPVIYADIKETIIKKIASLKEQRLKFVKNLNLAKDIKNKLEGANYYCQL